MYYYTILLYIRQNCIAIIIVVKGNPTTFYEINAKDDLSTSEFWYLTRKLKTLHFVTKLLILTHRYNYYTIVRIIDCLKNSTV